MDMVMIHTSRYKLYHLEFVKNWSKRLTILSIHSWLLHHVKGKPLNPRSRNSQSATSFWKSPITFADLPLPPNFSDSWRIPLKSPKINHGLSSELCKDQIKSQTSIRLKESRWPLTPVNQTTNLRLILTPYHLNHPMYMIIWKLLNFKINILIPQNCQTTTFSHIINCQPIMKTKINFLWKNKGGTYLGFL